MIVVKGLILFHYGHTRAGIDDNVSGRGIDFARYDFQECGFAGTVGPDYTVAIPAVERQIDALEQDASAV